MVARRRFPLLGAVGFDGGLRPAIALAIVPRPAPPEEEDDPCDLGDELELACSDFASCGCLHTFNPTLGSNVATEVKNLVIPATVALTATAPGFWEGTSGGTFDMYYDFADVCGSVVYDSSGTITFYASCFGEGRFEIIGDLIITPTFDPDALAVRSFPNPLPGFETHLGIAVTDTAGCAAANAYVRGGTVTLSRA